VRALVYFLLRCHYFLDVVDELKNLEAIEEMCRNVRASVAAEAANNQKVVDAANDQTSKSNRHVAKSQSLILYFNKHTTLVVSMTYIDAFDPIIYRSA